MKAWRKERQRPPEKQQRPIKQNGRRPTHTKQAVLEEMKTTEETGKGEVNTMGLQAHSEKKKQKLEKSN
jgi:hypothetical protein